MLPIVDSKKVSIILPVYNGEAHVAEAIASVLQQTYQNLELIVVNDCSTDGTLDILQHCAARDNRIRIINNPVNLKLPRTLNVGFSYASGDYYTWTSDDNLYKENAIERMVETLAENSQFDMVYADYTIIDEKGNESIIKKGEPKLLLTRNEIGACFLYTRQIAMKVGDYDPDLFLAEDYDYWLRIWRTGKILHIDENLYYYRVHKNSLTQTKRQQVGLQTFRTLEKHFLYLYSAAESRKERHALVEWMLRYMNGLDKSEPRRLLARIERNCIRKDLAKEKIRDTALGEWLRRVKGRRSK